MASIACLAEFLSGTSSPKGEVSATLLCLEAEWVAMLR